MVRNTTSAPTTASTYLVYDGSDPKNPRFVIASGWWSIPAAKADQDTPAYGTPIGDWLASLPKATFEWTGDAIDAGHGHGDVPESTIWATPLDCIGTLPDKLDPDDDSRADGSSAPPSRTPGGRTATGNFGLVHRAEGVAQSSDPTFG